MTITSSIDQQKQITIYRAAGIITYDKVIEMMRSFYAGKPTKFVLWDMNDVTEIDVSNEEIEKLAEFQPRFNSNRPVGSKTAIVAAKPYHFGLSRMFETYSTLREVPFKIQIFYTPEEAYQWLDE